MKCFLEAISGALGRQVQSTKLNWITRPYNRPFGHCRLALSHYEKHGGDEIHTFNIPVQTACISRLLDKWEATTGLSFLPMLPLWKTHMMRAHLISRSPARGAFKAVMKPHVYLQGCASDMASQPGEPWRWAGCTHGLHGHQSASILTHRTCTAHERRYTALSFSCILV